MKRFIIAAFALYLAAFAANAQVLPGTFTFQATSGINIAKTTGYDNKPWVRYVGGVDFGYKFTNVFALSLGAAYSGEGFTYSGDYYGKCRIDYINVPFLLNFYLYKGLALKTGVQPGFKINAVADGISRSTAERVVKDVNVSIPFGISYEVAGIIFDFRYNMGVSPMFDTRVIEDFQRSSDSAKGSVFQLTIGYKLALNHPQ